MERWNKIFNTQQYYTSNRFFNKGVRGFSKKRVIEGGENNNRSLINSKRKTPRKVGFDLICIRFANKGILIIDFLIHNYPVFFQNI